MERAPICKIHPEKDICILPLNQIERREQEIIDHNWGKVSTAVRSLNSSASMRMPSNYIAEPLYKSYCEAVRLALINKKYQQFRKPELASEKAGLKKFVQERKRLESDCDSKRRSDYRHNLSGYGFANGGVWLQSILNGYAIISFNLKTNREYPFSTYFQFSTDECAVSGKLPSFAAVDAHSEKNRIETIAFSVLQGFQNNLLAVEYGAVYGDGGNVRDNYGPYGDAFYQESQRAVTLSEPMSPSEMPKSQKFIGVHIIPSPWQHMKELNRENEIVNDSAPCIWQID